MAKRARAAKTHPAAKQYADYRDTIQALRQRIWERYDAALTDWAAAHDVRLPVVPPHCEQTYHMFYILLPSLALRSAQVTGVEVDAPMLERARAAARPGFDTDVAAVGLHDLLHDGQRLNALLQLADIWRHLLTGSPVCATLGTCDLGRSK